MLLEISLSIIAIALIALVGVLIKISAQIQRSFSLVEEDLHRLSLEMTSLVNTVNEFIQSDLHSVSKETTHLLSNLNNLSSDLNNKSHSLNFLFRPLSFLNSKLSGDSSPDEPTAKRDTIPQMLKWIASSAFLFKATREFIKK